MIFLKKYKKYILVLIIIISLIYIFTLYEKNETVSSVSANDWGLNFHDKNHVPTGNASIEYLKQFDAYYVAETQEKIIYLTFDTGYENGYTSSILDSLKKHEVSATFFLLGTYIKNNPGLVKRMVEEGHLIGNHSYHHPDLSKFSSIVDFKNEILPVESIYLETTGQDMLKIYRPPQGKFSEVNLNYAKELGYKTFFWSLAYMDWYDNKQPSKQEAFSKLLSRIHPGAIVMLHNTSKTNAEILDELLTEWKNMGYVFGSLLQLSQ